MRVFNLLSFRLFILIAVILLLLSFLVSYFQIQFTSENYERMITECASRASNLILASTRNSMLADHKEETYETIANLVKDETIERIRVYNKRGTIIFSSDTTELNKTVDMQNESCYMCHTSSGETILEPSTNERKRVFMASEGHRLMGFVTNIKNEASCYQSDCHAHSTEEKVLGTLDIIMSLKKTDAVTDEERLSMITNSILVTFILALTVGVFIWYFVHIPVKKIIRGMDEISSGNLNYKLNLKSTDEIGRLANSFNKMTSDLKYAKDEITRWSDELEKRVREKTNELKKTQDGVMQIEKMASIGKLSATVAHELNNPLAGILTYSKLIQKKLRKNGHDTEELEDIIKYLKMIESESDRCGNIIKNLLLFSKKGTLEIKPCDLNATVEQSILLIKHHLHLNNIELKSNLESGLPTMYFDENQIKQALLAMYLNAIEAMDKDGELKVETGIHSKKDYAFIKVTDSGKGIPDGIKDKIFEPFFTTKDEIKGVGLGLSTAYGIIKRHYGDILIESELNVGTTFTILLPLKKIKIENDE